MDGTPGVSVVQETIKIVTIKEVQKASYRKWFKAKCGFKEFKPLVFEKIPSTPWILAIMKIL